MYGIDLFPWPGQYRFLSALIVYRLHVRSYRIVSSGRDLTVNRIALYRLDIFKNTCVSHRIAWLFLRI
jgi:hypothetical protein